MEMQGLTLDWILPIGQCTLHQQWTLGTTHAACYDHLTQASLPGLHNLSYVLASCDLQALSKPKGGQRLIDPAIEQIASLTCACKKAKLAVKATNSALFVYAL